MATGIEAMNQAMQACAECGAELPTQGSLAGLCPECLMGHGAGSGLFASRETLPGAEELQELIPQLEILHMLGRGGMGAVYKARQRDLDRYVAVKVLRPELASDPALSDRFLREARNLARLDHPNIVHIHDFGRAGELYYLVMEYVDGSTLRDLIDGRLLAPKEALEITPAICDALQYAHELGVIHRDVKPGNILVDGNGKVKVADFGLSKMLSKGVDPTLTHAEQAMGTPSYMAPEQMRRTRDVDHRADIFSLGVLLFEMLTCELPVGRFEPPSKRTGLDPRIDEVVNRALDRDATKRYQHARELGAALVEIREGAPAAAGAAATKPQPQPETKSGRAKTAASAAGNEAATDRKIPLVPFSISGEFHEASGLLALDGDALRVEYRKRWGSIFPMAIRTIRVPLTSIDSVDLSSGPFKHKLRLVALTMAPFEDLPCSDYEIRFSIKRRDIANARELTEALRARLES